jgi:GDP-L-fucose synthase
MEKKSRIYVAGHESVLGSAMVRLLSKDGYINVITRGKSDLDLLNAETVSRFFEAELPEYVVLAAGHSGGILNNQRNPVDFLRINVLIALNVLGAAHQHRTRKLIYFCSSCMYPAVCPQPMTEEQLLTGKPELSSLSTALSKLSGMQLCLAYNQQYGTSFIPVIPNNTYGPHDNFDPDSGHVLSSLIHRFHEAKRLGTASVTLWGSGQPRREFVHADDVASACLTLLTTDVDAHLLPLNIGVGQDYSIAELAKIVAEIIGYSGNIVWDTEKPDGAPRKLLDNSRILKLGWTPSIELKSGIGNTYQWYLENWSK